MYKKIQASSDLKAIDLNQEEDPSINNLQINRFAKILEDFGDSLSQERLDSFELLNINLNEKNGKATIPKGLCTVGKFYKLPNNKIIYIEKVTSISETIDQIEISYMEEL